MSDNRKLSNRKILAIAALLSCIASAAYACPGSGHFMSYSFCNRVSDIGLAGILIAAALSIALLGGHGGGPLGMLLVIATPINCLLYFALGITARAVWRMLKKAGKST